MPKVVEGPYTVNLTVRVDGYGNDQQAAEQAHRIRQMLIVALGKFVNLTNIEVQRP